MGEGKNEHTIFKRKNVTSKSNFIKGMKLNRKIYKGRHPSITKNNSHCTISSFAIAGWLTLQCLAISSQAAEISGKFPYFLIDLDF